jgi:hypothetical protein
MLSAGLVIRVAIALALADYGAAKMHRRSAIRVFSVVLANHLEVPALSLLTTAPLHRPATAA